MELNDFLSKDLICLDLKASRRKDLFAEMSRFLVERGRLRSAQETADLLLERERLSSSGMAGGIAIPHAYVRGVKKTILLVGVSRKGIDFQSLETDLVYVVFLLIGPHGDKTTHIRLLAKLSRIMRNEKICEAILAADSPEALVQLLLDEEKKD